jgi:hypothetical protein
MVSCSFSCDPKTRAIAHHALPLPDMTFDAFKALSGTEQRSIVETLRLYTQAENVQESAEPRLEPEKTPHSYQIHRL